MQVTVFGTEGCAGCVTVKALLKQHDVKFVERDVMNVDHMDEAQAYGVRGIPTVIVQYEDTTQFNRFVGSSKQTLDDLIETVVL